MLDVGELSFVANVRERSTRGRRPFFDDPEAGRKLAVAQYRRKIVRRLQGEIS